MGSLTGWFAQMSTASEAQAPIAATSYQPSTTGGDPPPGYGQDAATRDFMERRREQEREILGVPFLEMEGGPGAQASGAQMVHHVDPKDCPTCGEKEIGQEHKCQKCPNCKCVVSRRLKLHYCTGCHVCGGNHVGPNKCYRPRPGATAADKARLEEQKRIDKAADHRERYRRRTEEKKEEEKKLGEDFLSEWAKTEEQKKADNEVAKERMAAIERNLKKHTSSHDLSQPSYSQLDFEIDTAQKQPHRARPSRPLPSALPSAATQPATAATSGTPYYDAVREAVGENVKAASSRATGTGELEPKAGSSKNPKPKEKRKSDKKPKDSTKKLKK